MKNISSIQILTWPTFASVRQGPTGPANPRVIHVHPADITLEIFVGIALRWLSPVFLQHLRGDVILPVCGKIVQRYNGCTDKAGAEEQQQNCGVHFALCFPLNLDFFNLGQPLLFFSPLFSSAFTGGEKLNLTRLSTCES